MRKPSYDINKQHPRSARSRGAVTFLITQLIHNQFGRIQGRKSHVKISSFHCKVQIKSWKWGSSTGAIQTHNAFGKLSTRIFQQWHIIIFAIWNKEFRLNIYSTLFVESILKCAPRQPSLRFPFKSSSPNVSRLCGSRQIGRHVS